jgi:hypothetical protein
MIYVQESRYLEGVDSLESLADILSAMSSGVGLPEGFKDLGIAWGVESLRVA